MTRFPPAPGSDRESGQQLFVNPEITRDFCDREFRHRYGGRSLSVDVNSRDQNREPASQIDVGAVDRPMSEFVNN